MKKNLAIVELKTMFDKKFCLISKLWCVACKNLLQSKLHVLFGLFKFYKCIAEDACTLVHDSGIWLFFHTFQPVIC